MQTDDEIRERLEREVLDGVLDRLAEGDEAARVVDALVADGFERRAAERYVDRVVASAEGRAVRNATGPRKRRSGPSILLGAFVGLLVGVGVGAPGIFVFGALIGWLVGLRRRRPAADRPAMAFGNAMPPLPPPPGDSDPVLAFLRRALDAGAIDHATHGRLQGLRLAATRPASAAPPAPPGTSAPLVASAPATPPPDMTAVGSVAVTPEPIERGPSALELRLQAFRDVIASDIAVHGLTYLGALLLFAGAFGFVLFSFGSVRVGLRPVAELGVPAVLLASAWYLRRRGAPFVATALGLVGGVLLPIFLFASFVDRVPFPPDLSGTAEIVALVLVSLATAGGYAAYARRVPEASVRYLVAPALWLAVWSAGLAFNRLPDGGVSLQRWSALQLAAVACAIALGAAAVRRWPSGRLADPTRVAVVPGIAIVYALVLMLAASEGWPATPIVVAGLAALLVTETITAPARLVAVVQPLVTGVSVLALAPALGAPWTGALAVGASVGLAERLSRRRPDVVGLAMTAAGIGFGLVASAGEPWPAVAAFGTASLWVHVRRARPSALAGPSELWIVAAAALPLGVGVGLVAALPDGVAVAAIATIVAAGAAAVRLLIPADPFERIWLPAAGAAAAIATSSPTVPPVAAAAAAAIAVGALLVSPGNAWVRTWLAAASGVWAVWSGAGALGVGASGRAVLVGAVGALLVIVSGAVRRDVGAHLGGAGLVVAAVGLVLPSAGWSRSGTLAAALTAATTAAWWSEARGTGPVGRAAAWLRDHGHARLADATRAAPVVAIAVGLPFLATDVAARAGVTDGRRSWIGILLAAIGIAEAVGARRLAGRRAVGPVAAVGAFATGVVGISVAAPDPWPVIVTLGAVVASTWTLGASLRRPAMTWIAWIASGALAVLLVGRTGAPTRDLWIAAFGWGVLALIGGLAIDEVRAGRRVPGEGVRTPWLWPPVALGALAVPGSLAFAFSGPPAWYAGWSLVAALVYLGVARQLRAGLVATPAAALVTLAAYVAAPPSLTADPVLLSVPWATALVLLAEIARRSWPAASLWARWDLGPLIVAHLVAGIALPIAVDTGNVPAVWTGFGVLAIGLAAVRANPAWGLGGGGLLLVAAAVAGPGWLALASAAAATATVIAAVRTRPPLRRACQGAAVGFAAVSWGSFVTWTGWDGPRVAVVTAAVGATLLVGPALVLKLTRVAREWPFTAWAVGLTASASATIFAYLPWSGVTIHEAHLLSIWSTFALSLAAGLSASRLGWRDQREAATAVALLDAAELGAVLGVRPVPSAVVSAIVGLSGVVWCIGLWRLRPGSPWIGSAIVAALVGDAATLVLAASVLPRGDVLEAALLLTGIECATAGLILRRTHLVAVSPLFAAAAWLLYASEAFRGEVQWFTVPSGLALLALVTIERDGRARSNRSRVTPELLALEVTGMVVCVAAALVEIVTVSPIRGSVAIVLGAGLATWGAMTEVRRRATFGAATVVLAVVLLLAVPIADLVPHVRGPALWLVLAGAGLVFILVATMLERGRTKVRELLRRLDELTEGWE
jgi:hypothetical protein